MTYTRQRRFTTLQSGLLFLALLSDLTTFIK